MRTYSRPGVMPLGNGTIRASSDAIALWTEALESKLRTGLSRADAIKAVVKSNPELHAAYVAQHNANVGPSSYRGPRA